MSDLSSNRFKPTEATESLYRVIRAHNDRAARAIQPQEPYQSAFIDDISAEFREWCERKRTCWPDSKDAFLSYCEFMRAKEITDLPFHHTKTHNDYSWVPSVLCDIFHSSLPTEPKLNILDYFLGLLSIFILSDTAAGDHEYNLFRDLLVRTVAPAVDNLTLAPNFLGALDPEDALNPTPRFSLEAEEIALVREVRRQLYIHTLDR